MIALLVVLAALTAAVLAALLLPVLRAGAALPGRARYDSAVYRDQLKELDRDVARGLIAEGEARTARLEIERRLLATDAAAPDGTVPTRRNPAVAVLLALLVAGGAAGLYLRLGAPGVPDTSFAARVAARGTASGAHPDMAQLAATLGEKLRANPNNPEGWMLYARTLASIGNWQGAAEAWRQVIALGAGGADAYAGYGEMLVLATQGAVTPAARDQFAKALKADPANPVARYYLALADAQDGHGQAALDAWVKLAGETADEDMRAEIAHRLTETAKLSGLPTPTLPPAAVASPAPTQQDAAANMSEADRTTMVNGMVAQLAARLAADPNDFQGWMRLGRAYAVLAEHDKAADAYRHAAALKPGDAEPLIQGIQALVEVQKPDAPIPRAVIDLLQRVEQIDPKQPEVLWYLGVAAAQSGHADAAEAYWRRTLDALPADSPDRKVVNDAIDALKK